jgi:hypothetical protein
MRSSLFHTICGSYNRSVLHFFSVDATTRAFLGLDNHRRHFLHFAQFLDRADCDGLQYQPNSPFCLAHRCSLVIIAFYPLESLCCQAVGI